MIHKGILSIFVTKMSVTVYWHFSIDSNFKKRCNLGYVIKKAYYRLGRLVMKYFPLKICISKKGTRNSFPCLTSSCMLEEDFHSSIWWCFYQVGKVWISFYAIETWRSIVKMLPSLLYSTGTQLPQMTEVRNFAYM